MIAMIRTATRLATIAAIAIAGAAVAQEGPVNNGGDRINQIYVYGDDPCPAAQGDEIVVCGRLAEDERYRIPEPLRGDPNNPARESWTARVQSFERVGRFGTDSCSPVGLGGFTGCVNQLVNNAVAERQQAAGTDWTNAVAEQRRLRMEGFDAEANAVEAQVLADERARIARETEAEAAAQNVDAEPLPTPPPR
jgi:signal transduction histidine kinase